MGKIIDAHNMKNNLTPILAGLAASPAVWAKLVPVAACCSQFQAYLQKIYFMRTT